jgi:hypothetical protein
VELETILLYYLGRFVVEKSAEDRACPEDIIDAFYLLRSRLALLGVNPSFEGEPPDARSVHIQTALIVLTHKGVEFSGFGGIAFPSHMARFHVLRLRHELHRDLLLCLDQLFPSFFVLLRKQNATSSIIFS